MAARRNGRTRSDGQLARDALAGDPSAWEELVDRHAQAVWTVARRHGLEAAESADVSLVTWLRCADHLDDLGGDNRIGEWLAASAARECRERRPAGPLGLAEPATTDGDGATGRRATVAVDAPVDP